MPVSAPDGPPDRENNAMVNTFPHLVLRELVAFLAVLAGLFFLALVFNAPLRDKADPMVTPNPVKAPWYFVGIQELLHYFNPLIGGIFLPALPFVMLVILPYLDRNPDCQPGRRKAVLASFGIGVVISLVLIIIGQFFRGPSWQWVSPW